MCGFHLLVYADTQYNCFREMPLGHSNETSLPAGLKLLEILISWASVSNMELPFPWINVRGELVRRPLRCSACWWGLELKTLLDGERCACSALGHNQLELKESFRFYHSSFPIPLRYVFSVIRGEPSINRHFELLNRQQANRRMPRTTVSHIHSTKTLCRT